MENKQTTECTKCGGEGVVKQKQHPNGNTYFDECSECNVKKNVHFSSQDQTWSTPQDFYNELNKEFNFTLDPCCSKETAKCEKFYTEETDGLAQSWDGETVFMNPPYGRVIGHWIKKASEIKNGTVVCLIPSRTDTRYFHDYLYQKENVELRFLKGRLKFGNAKNSAPFPSLLAIIKNLY